MRMVDVYMDAVQGPERVAVLRLLPFGENVRLLRCCVGAALIQG